MYDTVPSIQLPIAMMLPPGVIRGEGGIIRRRINIGIGDPPTSIRDDDEMQGIDGSNPSASVEEDKCSGASDTTSVASTRVFDFNEDDAGSADEGDIDD